MYLAHFISLLLFITFSCCSPLRELIERIPDAVSAANNPKCPDYCEGTQINKTLIYEYVCGDVRLGPKRLPTQLPLGDLVDTYDRFGGLCPGEFLAKWYSASTGFYIYPPDNGFQLNTAGVPIQGIISLPVGFLIDRFGSEHGTFVSPKGAPFMQRALPPSNLDTPAGDPRYPYDYHVYKVVQEFTANAGPIAAWFGQPGQGVQYQLQTNIMGLLSGGYIVRVSLKD